MNDRSNEALLARRAIAEAGTDSQWKMVIADIDEILRLRELVDGYKVSMEEAQEIISELDQEADWLADQVQKTYIIDGKGKTKCIWGAKEWRELAKAMIATQPAAESTASKGPSWSWSKQDA